MIQIRRSDERGHADHGWLQSKHTFSFAGYYDPRFVGFRDLLVINEDRVAPGAGFPTHPHRDMEIISYVVEGALEHKDSMGNGSVIRPGDVQRMSAGSGVTHSEYNHAQDETLRFLQIWVKPRARGRAPSYAQAHFDAQARRNQLKLVASPDGAEDSIRIDQDVRLYSSILEKDASLAHHFDGQRYAWVQVIEGSLDLDGHELQSGDGAAIGEQRSILFDSDEGAHFLLFDLR